jgi:signal transduction histidine kinase
MRPIRQLLFPADESDPSVRAEMLEQVRAGGQVLAVMSLVFVATGAIHMLRLLVLGSEVMRTELPLTVLKIQPIILAYALMLLLVSPRVTSPTVGRALSAGLCLLASGVVIGRELALEQAFVARSVGFVYFTTLAITAFRPRGGLVLGSLLTLEFMAAVWLLTDGPARTAQLFQNFPVFLTLILGGTVLTGVLYATRRRVADGRIETQEYARRLEAKNRELAETQLQLVQTEKMASLGNLVAGIAHELNTPMGAIRANADLSSRALTKLEQGLGDAAVGVERPLRALKDAASTTAEAAQRITKMVRSLRSFARLDEAEMDWFDLRDCVESTLPLLQHELQGGIEIRTDLEAVPKCLGHPNQMNQVLMNLLTNAIHAVREAGGGTIDVRTTETGEGVVLEVADDGVGIAAADLPRVFDPGFTTKGVGVGTGLGLSIVYRIVQRHRGYVELDSTPEHGTTARVVLPVQGPSSDHMLRPKSGDQLQV